MQQVLCQRLFPWLGPAQRKTRATQCALMQTINFWVPEAVLPRHSGNTTGPVVWSVKIWSRTEGWVIWLCIEKRILCWFVPINFLNADHHSVDLTTLCLPTFVTQFMRRNFKLSRSDKPWRPACDRRNITLAAPFGCWDFVASPSDLQSQSRQVRSEPKPSCPAITTHISDQNPSISAHARAQ